jgi:hypothetical protein
VGDEVVLGLTTQEYSHYSSSFQLYLYSTELESTSSVYTVSDIGGMKPKELFRMDEGIIGKVWVKTLLFSSNHSYPKNTSPPRVLCNGYRYKYGVVEENDKKMSGRVEKICK